MVKALIKAVIALLIITSALYIVSYSKWNSNNFDNIDYPYKEHDEDETKTKTVSGEKYKYLYDNVHYELIQNNFGSDYFDYYYKEKKFDDEFYIYIAIINIIKSETITNCNIEKEINEIVVHNKINEIFGQVTYNNKSFKTSDDSLIVNYDVTKSSYIVKTNKCSNFEYTKGGIKTEYVKASIINNDLYIYEKALYLDYSYDENNALIFNYHSDLTKDSKIISNNYESIDLNNIKTFIYKFKKSGNNYYFTSIIED